MKVEDSDIQFNIALIYYNGKIVSQDYSKAVIWFQKSAEQGNDVAIWVCTERNKMLEDGANLVIPIVAD